MNECRLWNECQPIKGGTLARCPVYLVYLVLVGAIQLLPLHSWGSAIVTVSLVQHDRFHERARQSPDVRIAIGHATAHAR